jgi:hypothetical protein
VRAGDMPRVIQLSGPPTGGNGWKRALLDFAALFGDESTAQAARAALSRQDEMLVAELGCRSEEDSHDSDACFDESGIKCGIDNVHAESEFACNFANDDCPIGRAEQSPDDAEFNSSDAEQASLVLSEEEICKFDGLLYEHKEYVEPEGLALNDFNFCENDEWRHWTTREDQDKKEGEQGARPQHDQPESISANPRAGRHSARLKRKQRTASTAGSPKRVRGENSGERVELQDPEFELICLHIG